MRNNMSSRSGEVLKLVSVGVSLEVEAGFNVLIGIPINGGLFDATLKVACVKVSGREDFL